MKTVNRQSTAPVKHPRSRRPHDVIGLTSMPAGKCVPLAVLPMLREDAATGQLRVAVEMAETYELIMNPVKLRVSAFCVPWLAFERFQGSRDQFDRSYAGQPQIDGGAVIPFVETHARGALGAKPVYDVLGLHGKSTDNVNTMYLEAYNAVVNYRRKNRSKDLPMRTRLDATLAEALWPSSRFAHVVPDFDMAAIDGQISLNLVTSDLELSAATAPITGGVTITDSGTSFRLGAGASKTGPLGPKFSTSTDRMDWTAAPGSNSTDLRYERGLSATHDLQANLAGIVAEMTEGGFAISLANLELAKKTQAFARVRERYDRIDDDYIIDMLMSGLRIPDQHLKQPFQIAEQMVNFSQVKRYATDAGNQDQSAVSGAAMVDLRIRVPRIETGGVIVVIAEAVPEQLFERQRDPLFHLQTVDELPDYVPDFMDTQKVDYVYNREVDTAHAVPDGVFGYAPLNWKWAAFGPRIGGKFIRPSTDTTEDEERLRIWAMEAANPVLSEDFYQVSETHVKPFLDQLADPFEATVMGQVQITGLTVFGATLLEATGNYDAVLEKAPTEQIESA